MTDVSTMKRSQHTVRNICNYMYMRANYLALYDFQLFLFFVTDFPNLPFVFPPF